ncbi:MAG: hypothetical protein AVDCRST_MAG51-3527, partial [uncultured Ramlibacter sp.]
GARSCKRAVRCLRSRRRVHASRFGSG